MFHDLQRPGFWPFREGAGRLPQPVKFEEAKAEYQDGVLTLTLPKAPTPRAETHTIPIAV